MCWCRQRINARFFLLDLETEAGTYVKEFVSTRTLAPPPVLPLLPTGHMSSQVQQSVGAGRGSTEWHRVVGSCWAQVHGDMGRTQPSLAGLLQCDAADILQLDVVAVQH